MAATKIVITGGPCAGKTSALEALPSKLAEFGLTVIIVKEAATDLILQGIAPWTCGSMFEFQKHVIGLQLKREHEAAVEAAREMAARDDTVKCGEAVAHGEAVACYEMVARDETAARGDVLIIADRGICDGHAYLSDAEYLDALAFHNLTDQEACARYDAILHLDTAALLGEEAYTRANNSARSETAQEAIALDERTYQAWENHPYHVRIKNQDSFKQKLDDVINCIRSVCSSTSSAVD